MMDDVIEAKEAAVREVTKLLSVKENLLKINTLKADILQRQQANDALLSMGVASQVEYARNGFEVLAASQKSVEKLRSKFILIDKLCVECKSLIEHDDRIKLLSYVRNNLNTVLKDVEGMMSIAFEAADARESLDHDTELVHTFESLTALEGKRRFALAAVSSRNDEASKLSEYFEDVDHMREQFEQVLWNHIANYLQLAKDSPQTLVRALRVVVMQENLDQLAAEAQEEKEVEEALETGSPSHRLGTPRSMSSSHWAEERRAPGARRYKDKCYEVIRQSVQERFDVLLERLIYEDFGKAMKEATSIAEELPDIYDYVAPCFPPRFEIFQLLVQLYTTHFVTMLQRFGDRPEEIDVFKIVDWVEQYQSQLLELGVSDSLAQLLSESGAVDPLMDGYIDVMQSNLKRMYTNILEIDKVNGPNMSAEGRLSTPAANDLFQLLGEQVSHARENSTGIMLFRTALAVTQVMTDFQDAERLRLAEPVADIGLEMLCAMLNNNLRCQDLAVELSNTLMEHLPHHYSEKVNFDEACKGFLEVAKEVVPLIMQIIFEDPGVKELIEKLYQQDWYDGVVTEHLVATYNDYFGDIKRYIDENYFRRFAEMCLERTIISYLDGLLLQKSYIKEETLERMALDEQLLVEFFRDHVSAQKLEKRMQPLLDLKELAEGDSVEAFLMTYTQILQSHPDCPPEVVEKVLNLREGIPRKERNEVVHQCREVYNEALANGGGAKPGNVFSNLTCLSKNGRWI